MCPIWGVAYVMKDIKPEPKLLPCGHVVVTRARNRRWCNDCLREQLRLRAKKYRARKKALKAKSAEA